MAYIMLAIIIATTSMNLAIAGLTLLVLRRHNRRIANSARPTDAEGVISRKIDRELWPQIEGLITLYRVIDQMPKLPPTRRWAGSPDFLRILAEHIESAKPTTIVECGSGTSTVIMAHLCRALGQGHIYSIENHDACLDVTCQQLESEGVADYVTLIHAPLGERSYDGFDHTFLWYDVDRSALPETIDMLVIDGPQGSLNPYARYPAGPELFPRLAPLGRIFLDDAKRGDEKKLRKMWRAFYPDLGMRLHDTEKGCLEIFHLDQVVRQTVPFRRQQSNVVDLDSSV